MTKSSQESERNRVDRPSNDVIAQTYSELGSIRKTAEALGWSPTVLREWARKDPALGEIFYGDRDRSLRTSLASKDAELRELRRETKKLAEIVGRRQEWVAEVVEAARVPVKVPTYYPRATKPDGKLPQRSIVIPVFDLQYGSQVRGDEVVLGRGGFDASVFDARLAAYVEKVTALLSARAASVRFSEMNLILGGDLVEGDQIFAGQQWQLDCHPIRQVLDLRVKLGAALEYLISFAYTQLGVEHVAMYGIPGNHGKVGGKRSGSVPPDYSWDWMATELIFDQLREQRIDLRVNEAGGAILFETLGHTFLVTHGDEISGHSGIPFYGFAKADGRYLRLSQVLYQYHLCGHIHQPANLPNGSGGATIVSGDWVGPTSLSRTIIAGSRPQQTVLLVARKHGLVEENHIYLDDPETRKPATVHRVGA